MLWRFSIDRLLCILSCVIFFVVLFFSWRIRETEKSCSIVLVPWDVGEEAAADSEVDFLSKVFIFECWVSFCSLSLSTCLISFVEVWLWQCHPFSLTDLLFLVNLFDSCLFHLNSAERWSLENKEGFAVQPRGELYRLCPLFLIVSFFCFREYSFWKNKYRFDSPILD